MARRDGTSSYSVSRYILFIILCLIAIIIGIWILTAGPRGEYDGAPDAVMDIETVTVTSDPTPAMAQ